MYKIAVIGDYDSIYVVASFLLGFLFTLIVALAYPLIDVTGYGVEGLWFASTDAILVSVFMRLIGMIAGV